TLQFASLGFDASAYEIFNTLLSGGILVLAKKEDLLSAEGLKSIISRNKVEVAVLPSSYQQFLKDALGSIKTIVSAGEPLNEVIGRYISSQGVQLINAYGPTENTVCATLTNTPILENGVITIGKPIANTSIYIVDKSLRLSPIGVAGEICIGGVQVARGYLGRPDLTAEKFISNPFDNRATGRIYRTGDLGRWLHDGNIEYLGRIDDQVKIRGYRIELGEIENVLLQSQLVEQAVVLPKEDSSGNKRLVGYIVAKKSGNKDIITSYLNSKLPEYMVPSLWVELESFPVTPNGKVDKKALPDPDERDLFIDNFAAPRTENEARLAEVWQQVLGLRLIGVNNNFFEIGGHSLLAMQLISAVRKQLKAELSIRDLFSNPTIKSLAKHLEGNDKKLLLPPIEPQVRPEFIPLSYSQERLWFINQLEGSLHYHVPAVLRLTGNLNKEALSYALRNVVNRHEVLRTVIKQHNEQGYQQVQEKDLWQLSLVEPPRGVDDKSVLQELIRSLIEAPFNLESDHMLRASLVILSDQEHLLVVAMHHIASDGWSLPIVVNEVTELYNSFVEGYAPHLADLPIQYADFAIWQRNYLQGELLDNKLGYWINKLKNLSPLDLLTDYTRAAVPGTKGGTITFGIDKDLSNQIKYFSQQQNSTLFMTLLSVFKVMLFRYIGQNDITIGTPIAGRQQQEIEGLIGFFVNTLALRTEVNGRATFLELLQQVRTTTLEAYEHQEVPFEKVVEAVAKDRDISRSPLFQVMFVLQNASETSQVRFGEVQVENEILPQTTSKFDITFSLSETTNGLKGSVEYSTELYNNRTIESIIEHYTQLLKSIVEHPGQAVSALQMLTAADEQKLLVEFNNSVVDYPTSKTVIELFEEQVDRTPATTAVVFEGKKLTYKELNERANQLARYLQGKGVEEETLVAICIDRSIEMIVGLLGILKAGGAYVPIDPEYPIDRIQFMLEDSSASVIITSDAEIGKLHGIGRFDLINLNQDSEEIKKLDIENINHQATLSNLAYVIYTSGSTGKPKGVMIEHGSMLNYVLLFKNYFQITEYDTIIQQSSISFDILVEEVYPVLITGGSMCLIRNGGKDVAKIKKHIESNEVTILTTTPMVLDWLNKELTSIGRLRHFVVGGDVLNPSSIDNLFYKNVQIVNGYGPSETTVSATYNKIEKISEASLLGKPIDNVQIYVLDTENRLMPVGVPGEICIGGAGLARGYLNRPDLTTEKFIKNPFNEDPDARLYKTGDLGRWLPNGNIESLGRIDDQVKIRGYRIELGEVESVLLLSALVKQAVVLAKEVKGIKRLVAYVVVDKEFDRQATISYLQNQLPEYMVPTIWVELESLPLSPNGKIDKKTLPDPDISELLNDEFVAPRNLTESALAEIWQQLLNVERVGINDNFFELGGHSLLGMRLISVVRNQLNVELAIRDLFLHPTIAQLATHLSTVEQGVLLPSIIPVQLRPERIPLSFSQERLWFIDKLEGSIQYHIPAVFKLKGNLDKEALQFALQTVINRHEVLRTIYREDDGQTYQVVKDIDEWKLKINNKVQFQDDEKSLQEYTRQIIAEPFDLTKDDVLRANLLSVSDQEHLLVVTVHHIAIDGWSFSNIVREVVELYSSHIGGRVAELPKLYIQYADYALWQRKYFKGELLDKKLAYWRNKLDELQPLELPTDYVRPVIQTANGSIKAFEIDKRLMSSLNQLGQQQGATLFMTLLAAFKVLLFRYSNQEDICVGTATAGRQQLELEGLIGFFINTLALRDQLNGEMQFTQLLQQVRQTTMEAFEHQDVPFEKVVEAIVKERDMSRSALFQVMFSLQNTPDIEQLKLGDVELSQQKFEISSTKFDLLVSITESAKGLAGVIQYNTDLYGSATIDRMIRHYQQLLVAIIENQDQKLATLQMLTKEEESELLVKFNNATVDFPEDKTIVDLFEENVIKTPDTVAVVFEDEQLTYQELNERANQVAHYLKSRGVSVETLVPICIERSLEMLIGLLGILKAGGAYVPLDPKYPKERIKFIIADTRAHIVVTSKKSEESFVGVEDVEIFAIDRPDEQMNDTPAIINTSAVKPNNLAYVIYTSGSTGTPKGVMIEHRALLDHCFGVIKEASLSDCSSFALFAPLIFDAGHSIIHSSFILGASLHVVSDNLLTNGEKLVNYLDNNEVECIKIVPSLWISFADEDHLALAKRVMIFGGEGFNISIINRLSEAGYQGKVFNHYGPTEATIGKCIYPVNLNKQFSIVPIGRPFSNTKVYIVDISDQLVPIGVSGQLYIGGEGLAREYLNEPVLTAEKFIKNPFSRTTGERVYKTGDLCRWSSDGNIVYLGRLDDQVKIRGYRIEPGEIENLILQSDLVKEALVLA
ncbi:MAG: amino acid adenylation domain protein, partial [Segetibacter sp.]|nr:amino acid adenylation domain protein [Segetibacter sp.]